MDYNRNKQRWHLFKANINNYIKELQSKFIFDDDTYESKIAIVDSLLTKESELKKKLKQKRKRCM